MNSNKSVTANFSRDEPDQTPPYVDNCSPQPDSIQVPVNSVVTFHIVDTDTGVDANSVEIKVNGNTVYTGNQSDGRLP
jgi:hypothetical protein